MPSEKTPDFRKGEVIVSCQPFVFIICAKFRSSICESCFGCINGGPRYCRKCGCVAYCSRNCQDKDGFHPLECHFLCQSAGQLRFFVEDKARLIARMVWKIKHFKGSKCYDELPIIKKKRFLSNLMDHKDQIEQDCPKLLMGYWNQIRILVGQEGMPSWNNFLSLVGKIMINSFSLKTERMEHPKPFGTGIYLSASHFDHSCIPNASAQFRGSQLEIIACQDIQDAGEDLSNVRVSYVNTLETTKTRNREQEAIWYFTCQCQLCKDSQLDSLKSSLKCCSCQGPRCLDQDGGLKEKKCGSCGCQDPQDQDLRLYKFLKQKVLEILTSSGSDFEQQLHDKYFPRMEEIFHPLDVTFIKVAHQLQQWHHVEGQWAASIRFGRLILDSLKTYLPDYNEDLALLHHCLGLASFHLGQNKDAIDFLSMADDVYQFVPGKQHPFYTQDFLPQKTMVLGSRP